MKKLILAVTGLFLFTFINAQSLEEIVKKVAAANKQDKFSSLSTIKITGKMSMMGMEMKVEIWMKNPNKIKQVTNMNGQEIVSVFDGEKGYAVNPMTGATAPVEMTPEQIKQIKNAILFQNALANYLKNGQLALEGEDKVNEKPCYKLKVTQEGGNVSYQFVDKASFLVVKTTASMNQQGQTIEVETYPSNYTETGGILLPMKTTASFSGMDMVTTYDKVEVNIPIDDSIFKLK